MDLGEYPRLLVDDLKIEENARVIVELAKEHGIGVTGVTKATCGDPGVARAMIRGGVTSIGESRVLNIKRLRSEGLDADILLLRTPMASEVDEVIDVADISLNSEMGILGLLNAEAEKREKVHKVVPMVEMGDLREGFPPEELFQVLEPITRMKGLSLHGLGMNLACFGGVVPTSEKVEEFEEMVEDVEDRLGMDLEMISSGNSANIPLLTEGHSHGRTNNLRIGEGILLGLETVNRTAIPGTHQDAFVLEAEIIEKKSKPSKPQGTVSQNAFGEIPSFEDRGEMVRGIAAVGRQDAILEDLVPIEEDLEVLGGSSDHLLLDMEGSGKDVGDHVRFIPAYGALVHLCTSEYVNKVHF
ncbi:MAG: alanine/ornithine racemase family PLP-dependent enzyme [Candidatus Thermoplasmatota archaeon]|nr:alanine/ornithine racemase family PLP-dependent enzyme [Candidatus Thermoplasmatota archaeon]